MSGVFYRISLCKRHDNLSGACNAEILNIQVHGSRIYPFWLRIPSLNHSHNLRIFLADNPLNRTNNLALSTMSVSDADLKPYVISDCDLFTIYQNLVLRNQPEDIFGKRQAQKQLNLIGYPKCIEIRDFGDIEEVLHTISLFFARNLVKLIIRKSIDISFLVCQNVCVKTFDFRKLPNLKILEFDGVVLPPEIFNSLVHDISYPTLEKFKCEVALDNVPELNIDLKSKSVIMGSRGAYMATLPDNAYIDIPTVSIEYHPALRVRSLMVMAGVAFCFNNLRLPNPETIPESCFELLHIIKHHYYY